jgi:hypothetical protein
MKSANTKPEVMGQEVAPTLNVADPAVRGVRDHLRVAKTRVEIAMQYTMWSEVREELRAAHSELTTALAHISG